MKLLILALTVSAVYASTFQVGLDSKPAQDRRQLYGSKLLHYVQMSGIFPDSKTFVDMRLKRDERSILLAFDELLAKTNDRPTKEQLADFINYNFDSESGLESWRPSDFVSEPGFLNSIRDSELKLFARNVYSMLPTLGRKIKSIVFQNPKLFSMIPVQNGFIVPGGNSKEFNYMESYWIIESLLVSGMKETAKGMISNFIELQREFGYIPSGDRYYYLGRSQPPLLSAMMAIYIQETNDIEFLRANIDAIEGELEYWLDTHSVVFNVAGREHSLLRYITKCRGPRPEEYYQDFTNAQVFDNEQRQEQFYTDVKAAGESGWVQSSRWILNKNGSNLGDLSWMHTTDIVPVDLNAIFASATQNVAHFYSVLNNARRGAHWLEIRKRWVNSIKEVLWNEEEGMWFDFDLSSSQQRKYFYTSNLSPLWMGIVEPEFIKAKSQLILNYLRKTHSLEFPGGVPASLIKSGYLYDLPYAWPAQVTIVVNALEALQTEESSRLAFEVAQNLVRSMYKAYQTNKQLYAKYDVETPGKPLVASGEYLNEEAFGGTIGVIIEMLAKYGATMTSVRSYVPFQSKFGQSSQYYSTSAPQIVNYQYSGLPAKPLVSVTKPESPIKPIYVNDYKQPSIAPTYSVPSTYLASEPTRPTFAEPKPQQISTLKEEEYASTTYKPEYITSAPIKPYQPIPTEAKLEAIPPVYNKPSYTTFTPQKPTLLPEAKPEVVPTVSKPSYTSFTSAQPSLLTKPQVAPTVYPSKPLYSSIVSNPQYYSTVKPTFVTPTKPVQTLQDNIEYAVPSTKPSYVEPLLQKPQYPSVEANPEPQLLEKKPEYLPVAPAPLKPEYISSSVIPESQFVEKKPEPESIQNNPAYLTITSVPQKPAYLPVAPVPQKPELLPVAPVPQKPEYLPVAPVPQKPELLPVAPVPQKPVYLPTGPVPQKPEYLPAAPLPQKPVYLPTGPVPQKPEYLPTAPLPQKPAYLPAAPVPQKPEYFPAAPLPQKPEYISIEAKPEPQLLEKKPEYVTEETISSTTYEPQYASTAEPEQVTRYPAKPEQVTLYPAKPAQVTLYPAKPEQNLYPAKPAQVFYPAKPAQVSVYPAKPTFASLPQYTTSVKVPFVSAVKPLNNVQAKPEYISSTEFQPEEVATTLAPKYEATTTSKPEQLYPSKPTYVASLPIKHEYIHSEASLPVKEVNIQASPVKPAYGSQTIYVSSTKKPSLIAAAPVQAQKVSYTESSYRQPGYSAPAISESKYTTSYPATIEYESSTIAKPVQYSTLAASEYPTTVHTEFEYATTESQFDATVKPQYGYISVQSKPQAAALTISGSASTEKKPYFAGYSTFSTQKQEDPKIQTTYVSSVQSQGSGVAELAPTVSVSIPANQQVQGQIASQDQATVLQQSHFSYFEKPAPVPVVVTTLPPKTEGFSTFTKLNINNANASKEESSSSSTYVSSKPQFPFGTFGSGYSFNKTVTPSFVTSTVNVSGAPLKNNQKWTQGGQYVSSSGWQGSGYNKPYSYYSNYNKPSRWNTFPGQYQPQRQSGQYQTGQYQSGQYQAQYSSLYKPTVSSTTAQPLTGRIAKSVLTSALAG